MIDRRAVCWQFGQFPIGTVVIQHHHLSRIGGDFRQIAVVDFSFFQVDAELDDIPGTQLYLPEFSRLNEARRPPQVNRLAVVKMQHPVPDRFDDGSFTGLRDILHFPHK